MGPPDGMRYEVAGAVTAFDDDLLPHLAELPTEPIDLCRTAQSLVVPPDLAGGFGIADARHAEKSVRRASDLLRMLRDMDSSPIVEARSPEHRVVGTCRHFAVLSCAFLRSRGIAARARCGFATYFDPGKFLDHWVVEYWRAGQERWVRVDSEILGFAFVPTPDDLGDGEFLCGGEAWVLCRGGGADPRLFGVDGVPDAWGIAEVRGNAIRDLAALNKTEMLPWDEWGRMDASYKGETGPEYDELMDAIAVACASDDPSLIRGAYATEDLQVPASMIV